MILAWASPFKSSHFWHKDLLCLPTPDLYQCLSDQLSQNLKIWLRGATKKVNLNTHMELDMFPIPQI